MTKNLFTFLLAMLMSIAANAEIASGSCGTNVTWSLNDDYKLTISGTGTVTTAPWESSYKNTIKSIVVSEGITSLVYMKDYPSVVSVSLPSTLTKLNGLEKFVKLRSITIPGSVSEIPYECFNNCYSLTDVTIEHGVKTIGKGAFIGCRGLTSIYIPSSVTSITINDANQNSFAYCYNLYEVYNMSSVNIPVGGSGNWIKAVHKSTSDDSILEEKDGFVFYKNNGTYSLIGCKRHTEEITLPETINGNNYTIAENAFYNRLEYTKINIPNTISSIGGSAFYGCSNLVSVSFAGKETEWEAINIGSGNESLTNAEITFANADIASGTCGENHTWTLSEDGVLTISGTGAMDDFLFSTVPWNEFIKQIKSVEINEGITSIGWSAFNGCSNLTTVTIPNSVTNIGSSAFKDCSSLSEVVIPNSVTSIGSYAFYGCSSLPSVVIPNSVTSIGQKTFYDCSSLSEVVIPNSVTSIDYGAFYNCSSLSEVVIPNSVTSIGSYAFYNCSTLSSVVIPNSVTSIESAVFEGCSSLSEVVIPNSVTSIGHSAFRYCSSLSEVVIPNSVTSIGNSVFSGCSSLSEVVIPNSVTSIGSEAFYGCSNLTSVNIPNSVTSIGRSAFQYCSILSTIDIQDISKFLSISGLSNLTSNGSSSKTLTLNGEPYNDIVIPEGITSIPDYAFCDFLDITSIDIPNSVTSIGYAAFEGCSGLTSVIIPNSVTSIGGEAFYKCSGLTSFSIPNSVTSIGDLMFVNCSGLTSVTIPNSITSIGRAAFGGCSGLTSITIPNSVTSIGDAVFNNCTSLTSITIPNSVTSIGSEAFRYCSGLTSITIPNSVTSIGRAAFGGCSGLTSITIPNSVTSIGDAVFNNCTSLTSITIPNSVTSIGSEAFRYCSGLTSITIPNSVTSIGSFAFADCTRLTTVNYEGSRAEWESITIDYANDALKNATINFVSTDIASGTCGENLTWTLSEDGVLTISGTGAMDDFPFSNVPWNEFIKQINSVEISEGITSIGRNAFNGCSNLTTVTIPNSVTSIGSSAFSGCTGLTSVTIPNSVTNIGNFAFEGCTGLTSVTIPNSVTSIGSSAFAGCTGLTSVTIPNSTNVDSSAFGGCTSLPVENGIRYADTYLVEVVDKNRTTYQVKEGTRFIDYKAFQNCKNMTSVYIPNTITHVSSDTFEGCSALPVIDNIRYAGTILVEVVDKTKSSYTIKEGTTIISDRSFSECRDMSSLVIPNSVTSIGSSAFLLCVQLTSINIPNSVTHIYGAAFAACYRLSAINIPSSVTYIEGDTFDGCYSLRAIEVDTANPIYDSRNSCNAIIETSSNTLISGCANTVIPENISSIAQNAFYACEGLTSVTIPNSVTNIGNGAFFGCTGLTSVNYEGTEEEWEAITIGYNNEALTNATINFVSTDIASGTCGENLTWTLSKYGVLTISGTGDMENFINTPSHTEISGGQMIQYPASNNVPWYEYKSQITSVEIKEGITSIGDYAFMELTYMISVSIPNSITSIGKDAFLKCARLTTIDIPSSVVSIGEGAFSGCWRIESITIPDGVSVINDYTFFTNAGLTSIVIHKGVTSIGEYAFTDCNGLTSISSLALNVPATHSDAFLRFPSSCKVYVPMSAYSDYKNAAGWKDLNIIGVENGDVNLNGTVNITDAVEVVNNVLGNPSERFAEEWSDVNGDNQYTIADASAVINVILGEEIGTVEAKSRTSMGSDDLSIYRSNTNQLTMCMNNRTGYNAFQFDVVLPEDMSIDNVVLNQKRCADFSVMFREISAGHYTVAVFNFDNAAFATGSGSLLDIITSGVGNDEDIVISNIHFATTKATDIKFEDLMVGEATDINNINIANSTDGSTNIYDLNGRKLQNAKRGVNIINGKKVVNN